jgi:hypothetical protein
LFKIACNRLKSFSWWIMSYAKAGNRARISW